MQISRIAGQALAAVFYTLAAAHAQTAGEDLAIGQPVDDGSGIGSVYLAEEFGDWQLRCVRTEDGEDPCQLYQLLKDAGGNSVAEISLFRLPDGRNAEAGASIMTPLETLLTRQILISVDGGPPKRYPFTYCTAQGCIARVGFIGDDIAAFRRGSSGKVTIVPAQAPDRTVDLELSLSGFTAAYEALKPPAAN